MQFNTIQYLLTPPCGGFQLYGFYCPKLGTEFSPKHQPLIPHRNEYVYTHNLVQPGQTFAVDCDIRSGLSL